MELKNLLSPGNRLEVRLAQQVQQAKKTGEDVPCYKSSLFEVLDDKTLEITMPTEGEKLILFPVGVRLELMIFNKTGNLICQVHVKDRYKKENFYILKVQMLNDAKRLQRRNYFRLTCTLDMSFYEISQEMAELTSTEEILEELRRSDDFFLSEKLGLAVDISGGGMRFRGKDALIVGSNLLIILPLTVGGENKEFHIVSHVIASSQLPQDSSLYENRIKFVFKDSKMQECIVRYIFEEERRVRKKENG